MGVHFLSRTYGFEIGSTDYSPRSRPNSAFVLEFTAKERALELGSKNNEIENLQEE